MGHYHLSLDEYSADIKGCVRDFMRLSVRSAVSPCYSISTQPRRSSSLIGSTTTTQFRNTTCIKKYFGFLTGTTFNCSSGRALSLRNRELPTIVFPDDLPSQDALEMSCKVRAGFYAASWPSFDHKWMSNYFSEEVTDKSLCPITNPILDVLNFSDHSYFWTVTTIKVSWL